VACDKDTKAPLQSAVPHSSLRSVSVQFVMFKMPEIQILVSQDSDRPCTFVLFVLQILVTSTVGCTHSTCSALARDKRGLQSSGEKH
jgi:hypothetical protein